MRNFGQAWSILAGQAERKIQIRGRKDKAQKERYRKEEEKVIAEDYALHKVSSIRTYIDCCKLNLPFNTRVI